MKKIPMYVAAKLALNEFTVEGIARFVKIVQPVASDMSVVSKLANHLIESDYNNLQNVVDKIVASKESVEFQM